MRLIIIILISMFLLSCKTHKKTSVNNYKLADKYNLLLQKAKIGKNPLVVVNDTFRNYDSVDLLKYKNIIFNDIKSLKKDSNFYMMKFGKQAKDGILILNNLSFLDGNTETFYLINGNVVDSFSTKSIDVKQIESIQRVGPIRDINRKYIILYAMSLKNIK